MTTFDFEFQATQHTNAPTAPKAPTLEQSLVLSNEVSHINQEALRSATPMARLGSASTVNENSNPHIVSDSDRLSSLPSLAGLSAADIASDGMTGPSSAQPNVIDVSLADLYAPTINGIQIEGGGVTLDEKSGMTEVAAILHPVQPSSERISADTSYTKDGEMVEAHVLQASKTGTLTDMAKGRYIPATELSQRLDTAGAEHFVVEVADSQLPADFHGVNEVRPDPSGMGFKPLGLEQSSLNRTGFVANSANRFFAVGKVNSAGDPA